MFIIVKEGGVEDKKGEGKRGIIHRREGTEDGIFSISVKHPGAGVQRFSLYFIAGKGRACIALGFFCFILPTWTFAHDVHTYILFSCLF